MLRRFGCREILLMKNLLFQFKVGVILFLTGVNFIAFGQNKTGMNQPVTLKTPSYAEINRPEIMAKVVQYFKFVPSDIKAVSPTRVEYLSDTLQIKDMLFTDTLADDRFFMIATVGKYPYDWLFIYQHPGSAAREVMKYASLMPKKVGALSPHKDYFWFYEDCSKNISDGYNLKVYDIKNRQVHDVKDLLKNSEIFQNTANILQTGDAGGLRPREAGCFIDFSTFSYNFKLGFTPNNETLIHIIGHNVYSPSLASHKRVTFTIPSLAKLLQLKAAGTLFEVASSPAEMISAADWLAFLNPHSAHDEKQIKVTGNCIQNLPITNVDAHFIGIPPPDKTADGKYATVAFHYYLHPETLKATSMSVTTIGDIVTQSTESTATSTRFTGLHFSDPVTGCLRRTYVHGIGVLNHIFQYKNYLFTSASSDGHKLNRVIVWDMEKDKTILALELPQALLGVARGLFFDAVKKEVIGVVHYEPMLVRWQVPELFH